MSRHVYHLDLTEEQVRGARYVLLPGDPGRVPMIAERLAGQAGGKMSHGALAHRREYCTHLTDVRGVPVLVTSTGIGGPSAAIAIDELAQLGVTTFIRVGTTGAIQDYIQVGDVVIATGAVRLDGASVQYAPIEYPAVAHHEVILALIQAARQIAPSLGYRFHVGVTASTDTFYPAQERKDSFSGYVPRRFQGMTEEWRRLGVLNYEMEAATLLTLCGSFGLRGGCVTGVLANRASGDQVTAEALRLGQANVVAVAVKAVELLIKTDREA